MKFIISIFMAFLQKVSFCNFIRNNPRLFFTCQRKKIVIAVASFIFLFIYSDILAESTIFWSKEEISVGEEIYLTIETEQTPLEILSPEVGLFSGSNTLPFVEIISTTKDTNKIVIKMRFVKSGSHSLEVKWKNDDNSKDEKDVSVTVKSLVTDGEENTLDIAEPLEFSGPYLMRVLYLLLGFILVVALFSYLFLRHGKRARTFKDALYTENMEAEKIEPIDARLDRLLEQDSIPHKEFAYALSEYLKSALSHKLDSDTTYMTQSELEEILISKLRLSERETKEFSLYLNAIKYMPNEEMILSEKANSIRKYWERVLGV